MTTDPGTMLDAMRGRAPLVHCITNYVAQNIAANVLLAAGASPAMLHAPEEAEEFAAIAGALTVNPGTLSAEWLEGMRCAIRGATGAGRPWVLDPVALYASRWRMAAVQELAAMRPAVIRGNASEILALAGEGAGARGADAADPVAAAEGAARALALRLRAVVAVTGPVDFVTDGTQAARVGGGSALMPRVTALGCALTALVGAYAAVTEDRFAATVAALAHYGVAGARAGRGAAGPASFQVAFVDQLAAVDAAALSAEAEVTVEVGAA